MALALVTAPGVESNVAPHSVAARTRTRNGAVASPRAPVTVTRTGNLLDAPLGANGTASGRASTTSFGTFTACAFLEQQGDDRLFAFDDSTTFAVTHACTTFTRRAAAAGSSLRKVRRAMRHAHGAHRRTLGRRAAGLKRKLDGATAGRRRACHA